MNIVCNKNRYKRLTDISSRLLDHIHSICDIDFIGTTNNNFNQPQNNVSLVLNGLRVCVFNFGEIEDRNLNTSYCRKVEVKDKKIIFYTRNSTYTFQLNENTDVLGLEYRYDIYSLANGILFELTQDEIEFIESGL